MLKDVGSMYILMQMTMTYYYVRSWVVTWVITNEFVCRECLLGRRVEEGEVDNSLILNMTDLHWYGNIMSQGQKVQAATLHCLHFIHV